MKVKKFLTPSMGALLNSRMDKRDNTVELSFGQDTTWVGSQWLDADDLDSLAAHLQKMARKLRKDAA